MAFVKRNAKRVARLFKQANKDYHKARREPLDQTGALFEAGQGKNINGNMFALVREASWNDEFRDLSLYFVTTEDTDEQARARLARYRIEATTVIRNSPEYERLLGRCKYLFTDNSFPVYFHKREGQVCVNTWHGTPLKHLGRSNIESAIASFANIQKNMLSSDYLLFPNELTKDCFFKDYCLEPVFAGRYFMADYPRNAALVDRAIRETVRELEQLGDKRIVAYMPTWRGAIGRAQVDLQIERTQDFLERMDQLLGDEVVLYVNLHFLVGDTIDYSAFSKVRKFPDAYETYDFLAACDALVTDYSSVFFDFAVTERPIFMYADDKEEYLSSVGTYLPYDELPFPIVETAPELAARLNDERLIADYPDFLHEYCQYRSASAPRDLLATVCGREQVLEARENEGRRAIRVRYTRSFTSKAANAVVLDDIEHWPTDGMLVLAGGNNARNAAFLLDVPESVPFLITVKGRSVSAPEKILVAAATRDMRIARASKPRLQSLYTRERDRLLHDVQIEDELLYASSGDHIMFVLGSADCPKRFYADNYEYYAPRRRKSVKASMEICGYEAEPTPKVSHDLYEGESALYRYNSMMGAKLLTRISDSTQDSVGLKGHLFLRIPPSVPINECVVQLRDGTPIGTLHDTKLRLGRTSLVQYKINVDAVFANTLPSNNLLQIRYVDKDNYGASIAIKYAALNALKGRRPFCARVINEETTSTLMFRRGARGNLYLKVRATNPSDRAELRRRMYLGWVLSRITPTKNHIVLFEKNSSRYEESASVVYEKLIDEGYSNARFVIDAESPDRQRIPERYRAGIVEKDSVEHYRLFFGAKTFIGSEMLAHCIEIASDFPLVSKRVADPRLDYVFLQHGVMYMVSLNSASRRFFKKRRTTTGKYRVVVSSDLEAYHFIEQARYDEELIYKTGLPKFDRNTLMPGADRIVIMPTWRPWEANVARLDFRDTRYYQLIEHMVSAVPEELRDRLVILPHPLFKQAAGNKASEFSQYMDFDSRYDDILQQTSLLITDYSSIAYDAFYRGANVVFCWKDLEECMEAYGAGTRLMIDENSAFGDVCVSDSPSELQALIQANYQSEQRPEYVNRYQRIVEFHDGNNTSRLLTLMREDGIIS